MFEVENEDLAVTDLAGTGGLLDGFDHLVEDAVLDRGLDLHLGQEIDNILGAPVQLGVTKDVNGWVFGLSYVDTNAEGSCSKGQFYCFAKSLQDDAGVLDASSSTKDAGRGIAILSVSRSF